ncbi:MAG TPA: glycosyltransferase 87 family protein [Baekduia sp.]|nr:glycosyltransferase 87 family protein [Baekduia sp.]
MRTDGSGRAVSRIAPAVALIAVWLVATKTGPFSSIEVNDLYVYSVYADLLHAGQIPYLDFGFEYPPLALIPIGLLGGDELAFSIGMLVCALVCQWCAGEIGGRRAAWAMVALPLLAGAMVRTHFDLFVVALVMLALVYRRHSGWLLGAAAMAKLWPAAVALTWLRDRRSWSWFAGVCVALAIPALALGAFDLVRFHSERPVQIESTPASVLFALGDSYVTGHPVRPDRFKSNGLDGGPADIVGAAFTVLQLLALVWFVRNARSDPLRASLGATLAFVALGKVLSPQYMLWLFPLAVAAGGIPALLVAGATALTQVEFPGRYFDLVARDTDIVLVVAARNLLLIAALLATARAVARGEVPHRTLPSDNIAG